MADSCPSNEPKPKRRYWLRVVLLLGACAFAGAAHFGFWRYHLKRFDVVEAGVLYRTAQPTEFGIRHLSRQHGVRTVLSLRLQDPQLHRGLLDWGSPNGEVESAYVQQTGLRHLHWPMGEETYWPWLTPWQFEEFFKLFDDPRNLPVAVHCVGGRHRTGTLSALYRLEYERAEVESVLRQMLSFDFGPPACLQDHNLRTYRPRPRPVAEEWLALKAELIPGGLVDAPADFESLVRVLRNSPRNSELALRAQRFLQSGQRFDLRLAERIIDGPQHPWAAEVAILACERLSQPEVDLEDLASAAALVADFGTPQQQQSLYALLDQESKHGPPGPRYQALVRGVTNRYTPNRVIYLRPLLDDERFRTEPAAAAYRYCDTGVARLTAITNEPLFVLSNILDQAWNDARSRAKQWFVDHPDQCQFTQLLPPTGKNAVVDRNDFEFERLGSRAP